MQPPANWRVEPLTSNTVLFVMQESWGDRYDRMYTRGGLYDDLLDKYGKRFADKVLQAADQILKRNPAKRRNPGDPQFWAGEVVDALVKAIVALEPAFTFDPVESFLFSSADSFSAAYDPELSQIEARIVVLRDGTVRVLSEVYGNATFPPAGSAAEARNRAAQAVAWARRTFGRVENPARRRRNPAGEIPMGWARRPFADVIDALAQMWKQKATMFVEPTAENAALVRSLADEARAKYGAPFGPWVEKAQFKAEKWQGQRFLAFDEKRKKSWAATLEPEALSVTLWELGLFQQDRGQFYVDNVFVRLAGLLPNVVFVSAGAEGRWFNTPKGRIDIFDVPDEHKIKGAEYTYRLSAPHLVGQPGPRADQWLVEQMQSAHRAREPVAAPAASRKSAKKANAKPAKCGAVLADARWHKSKSSKAKVASCASTLGKTRWSKTQNPARRRRNPGKASEAVADAWTAINYAQMSGNPYFSHLELAPRHGATFTVYNHAHDVAVNVDGTSESTSPMPVYIEKFVHGKLAGTKFVKASSNAIEDAILSAHEPDWSTRRNPIAPGPAAGLLVRMHADGANTFAKKVAWVRKHMPAITGPQAFVAELTRAGGEKHRPRRKRK